jgi:hypothetical protein
MIVIHIVIAVLSLIFAVAALVRPSMSQIKIVGTMTVATLATGIVLIAQGANILHMCLSGLLFTSLTVAAMLISLRVLHRQQAAAHLR